ncbi:MAG: alanyl-tRNA editing protein [Thermoanaerobaculaceae bacterium]
MPSIFTYDRDPYQTSLVTTVVASGYEKKKGAWVILEDTLFFPEGGGQPSDSGTIAGVSVIDVQKTPQGIRHYLAGPVPQGEVHLQLDWARRFDHMQHHTGQHVLSAIAEDRFGLKTTAFHLGRDLCDVELDIRELPQPLMHELEEAVNEVIRQARPVVIRRIPMEELGRVSKLRSRGLPEGHQGLVRLVEIEGIDLATCGGTHLRNTAEIEALALVGKEPMRGGTRVYFVAGRRLRKRLAEHEVRNAQLRLLLGAADPELPEAVRYKLEKLEQLTRQIRHSQEELAVALGERLGFSRDNVVSWHGSTGAPAFLQKVAQVFLQQKPAGILLATSGQESNGYFLLAAKRSDLAVIGKEVCQILGGRGGGSGDIFQGKATRLDRRVQAWQYLKEITKSLP